MTDRCPSSLPNLYFLPRGQKIYLNSQFSHLTRMNVQKLLSLSCRMIIRAPEHRRFIQILNQNAFLHNRNKIICQCAMSSTSYSNLNVKEDGFMKKLFKSIPFLGINKSKMKLVGLSHYETLVDQMNYLKFFDELDIPDTFYGWFVITELHLWMLSVRAMAEGDEGRALRNSLVEALWTDVYERVKKLGVYTTTSDTKARIVELSEQLQATFIAYDEGLQGEDVVLAGALWRRFYQQREVDLQHLELLVKYIRKNMLALEKLNQSEFYDPKKLKWKPLE